MLKFLRVMIGLQFLLTIIAFVLGIMIFEKREILKGRTRKLEEAYMKLASTIEAETPAPPIEKPQYTARDVDECTSVLIPNPRVSDFWSTYRTELELIGEKHIDLLPKKIQLMTYYKLDQFGKIEKDEYGRPKTDGPGTMQEVLNQVQAKAEEQIERLNQTRLQMKKLREELISTIEELNQRKTVLREKLKNIVELNNTIKQQQQEIASLNNKISELQDQISSLNDTIQDLNGQIAKLQEEKATLKNANETLSKRVQELTEIIRRGSASSEQIVTAAGRGVAIPRISEGLKGSVVAVNEDYSFCIVKLSEDFMSEIFRPDPVQGEPIAILPVNLDVIREAEAGTRGKYITKIRLVKIERDQNTGIADILKDWEQESIKVGDKIWF